jgi:hypothetical protein
MFLRPPLLIAIAQSRVNKIPFSMLDDGNPWFDQLRKIDYDPESNVFYLATSEGIYTAERSLTLPLKKCMHQPPASVMGYNVFEFHGDDHILVGSFSGLYLWSPASGAIYDYISGLPHRITPGPAMPLSDNMISGFYRDHRNNEYYFDYNRGAVPLRHPVAFPAMPDLIGQTRIPLWNVALELHTARLFKPFMGDFYILFIPLFGLSTLLVLISGVVLWLRMYSRRKKK